MEIPISFNNQIDIGIAPITFPKKESRHGKHKPGYIRPEFRTPEGRKKWNERSLVGMRKLRAYRKSLKPKLTFDTLPDWKKKNIQKYWKCFARPWNVLANPKGKKGCIQKGWNKKWENKTIPNIIKANKNALLILENKKHDRPIVKRASLFEVDIDVKGFSATFSKCAYVSRKIGSVKFLGSYLKENDCCKAKTKYRVSIGSCKFDFKATGHSYFAGSTHEEGDLYDLKRSFGYFLIDKEINNGEPHACLCKAYQNVIHTIKKFEMAKELRKIERMRLEQQTIIEIPPK